VKLLGNWLYGVAYRVAVRAVSTPHVGKGSKREDLDMVPAKPVADDTWRDLKPVFDEELRPDLPDKYREPLVLCYLQGKTNKEAAEQLGCAAGSIHQRLTRPAKCYTNGSRNAAHHLGGDIDRLLVDADGVSILRSSSGFHGEVGISRRRG